MVEMVVWLLIVFGGLAMTIVWGVALYYKYRCQCYACRHKRVDKHFKDFYGLSDKDKEGGDKE